MIQGTATHRKAGYLKDSGEFLRDEMTKPTAFILSDIFYSSR